MAGIKYTTADANIILDVDLQDPIELIPRMVQLWKDGYEVVLASRSHRDNDTFIKRLTARLYYRLFNLVAEYKIPSDVGDFRLIDKKVAQALAKFDEKNLFLKGLFSWIGYKTTRVTYSRPPRAAGKTKFSPLKLTKLGLTGLINFSVLPLRIWSFIGALVAGLTTVYSCILLIRYIFFGIEVPGYLSIIITGLLIGGIQLLSLGLIGEYIGRIYLEVKGRPQFIIRQIYERNSEGA